MIFADYPVLSRTQEEIDRIALSWRLGTEKVQLPVDVLRIAAYAKVDLVVLDEKEMGEEQARACSSANRVFLRPKLRQAIDRHDPDARLQLGHEFGHIALHRTPELKALKLGGNEELRFVSKSESAEDQAWKFARALLIPPQAVLKYRDAELVAQTCLVTEEHARLRIEEVRDNISPELRSNLLADLQAQRRASARKDAEAELDEHRRKVEVWNSLELIPGKHPAALRKSHDGHQVCWNEYGKMTECGWLILHGRAYWWRAAIHR